MVSCSFAYRLNVELQKVSTHAAPIIEEKSKLPETLILRKIQL
jgi:hypothetical protein